MASSILIEMAIIVLLTLANGVFAASEIAIVSSRKGRLEQQAKLGNRGAAAALELAERPNHFLSTVQVGITLISTLAAVFGGASLAGAIEALLGSVPALAPYARSGALAIVVLLISYLSLILGELVPKRLALQSAEGVAARIAPLMRGLARLADPVVRFLTASTELVLRLLGRHNVAEAPVTEEDIIALVREGAAEGTVEDVEQQLIANVFSFTDRSVRSLMTPRTEVTALAIDTPLAEVLRLVAETGYSRLPVYEDSLDRVVGILYVKDLLPLWGRAESIELPSLLRQPIYVLESQRALVAFQQITQQRGGMAIVVDEYGQVAGLITLEDILEEVVGNIADEYDEDDDSIVEREDGSYLVDGLLSLADVRARMALPHAADTAQGRDYETVAGFLLALLGHIPRVGEQAEWQGYVFEVVDMDGRRIDKILVRPPASAQRERAAAGDTPALASPDATDRRQPRD